MNRNVIQSPRWSSHDKPGAGREKDDGRMKNKNGYERNQADPHEDVKEKSSDNFSMPGRPRSTSYN